MRFVRLAVEGFRCVERADLEFGPGLNILYGPNDLGKSTLAVAIRAALLVQPASAEARHFAPWHKDEAPRVRLVFQDDTEHYWRVKKIFGDLSRSGAELGTSKDGLEFATDAKSREVEDKIRKLLRWGISSPGGKAAPRGLPESFLAKVLLAPQTEVDDILTQSLATDSDETGKLRLSEALSALAQDPKFKIVLAKAQEQVGEYFAPGGAKRRGKESPFAKADADVKKWASEHEELRRQALDSKATEDLVVRLRAMRNEAIAKRAEAADALEAVRKRIIAARIAREAIERLEEAKVAVLAIQTRFEELSEADARLAIASVARADAIHVAEAAECAREQAEQELSVAEAAQRRATSEEGAHERALQRARLETELAELKSREHELVSTKACVERLIAAKENLDAAHEVCRQRIHDLDAARAIERDAGEAERAAEQELATSRLLVAYGKWRTAAEAAADTAIAFQEVEALHRQATEKDSEAAGLESADRPLLPAQEQFKKMRLLARELGNAEAALGGGITITIRARAPMSLTSTLDGTPSKPQAIDGAVVLDAERSARLELANLVEIDVQAGALDKRTAAGHLRARWEMEVVPVLLRAGARDLDELERMLSEADSARLRALQLRADAQSLRGLASQHEARATGLASTAKQVAAREQALGIANRAELAKAFEALGADWEQEVERVEADKQNVVDLSRQRNSAAAQLVATATYRVDDAEKQCERLAVALDDARGSAPVRADANVWLEETTTALASIAIERTSLEHLRNAVEAEEGLQVSAADLAFHASQKALDVAKSYEAETAMSRDAARSAYDTLAGQCETLRSQVAGLDRAAAETLCATREREIAVLPVGAPATETDVAVAERALEAAETALREVSEELLTADGGLQKVGGAVLRDNLLRVKEAVDAARERERSLQLEADSWQLLRDVLREVENQEGTHLGRALAGPVTARLRDLTSSRYGDLRLGPGLEAQGIGGVSGASPENVLAALSVGTKDQLATLLRLAIAQELRAPIVLDDHLVHTDPQRLEWFRKALRATAATTQVIVLTCRPRDYLAVEEMPAEDAVTKHLAGGAIHVVDLERVIKRWGKSLEAMTPRVASS